MDEATYVANYITNGGDKVIDHTDTKTLRTITITRIESFRSTLSLFLSFHTIYFLLFHTIFFLLFHTIFFLLFHTIYFLLFHTV